MSLNINLFFIIVIVEGLKYLNIDLLRVKFEELIRGLVEKIMELIKIVL